MKTRKNTASLEAQQLDVIVLGTVSAETQGPRMGAEPSGVGIFTPGV